jgi:hypothetical protein
MRLEAGGGEPSVATGMRNNDRQALASPHSVRSFTGGRRLSGPRPDVIESVSFAPAVLPGYLSLPLERVPGSLLP